MWMLTTFVLDKANLQPHCEHTNSDLGPFARVSESRPQLQLIVELVSNFDTAMTPEVTENFSPVNSGVNPRPEPRQWIRAEIV
jgi:hypothetical protein